MNKLRACKEIKPLQSKPNGLIINKMQKNKIIIKNERVLILILTFLFLPFFVLSQEKITAKSVDVKTYNLYLQKEWKELISVGKQAEKQGIKFYYLNYRLGIAYYELKNYRKAIPHFKAVLNEYSDDKVGKEYLFYSYLSAGMYESARQIWLSQPIDWQQKHKLYNNELVINSLGVEYKYFDTENYKAETLASDVLTQRITKSSNYFSLNIRHYAEGKFSLYHSIAYLGAQKTVYDQTYSTGVFYEKVKQFEYHSLATINVSEGKNLKFGLHFIGDKISATDEHTAGGFGGGRGSAYSQLTYYDYSIKSLMLYSAFEHNFSYFKAKYATIFAGLNDGFQFQPSIELSIYPFGNTSFYLSNEIFYHSTTYNEAKENSFVGKHSINISLANRVYLKGFTNYGSVRNFINGEGFAVYNSLDKINYAFGGSLSVRIGKNSYLYFLYQKYNKTNDYELNSELKSINYNSQTILGGLSWTF